MNIRAAVKSDIEVLSSFVNEWAIYQLLCVGFKFDPDIFKKHLEQIIMTNSVLVIEEEGVVVGGIGGRIVGSFYSNDIIFDVMTMYIDPEHRHLTGKVMESLEKILSMTTVTKIVLANPVYMSKHNRYYKMKGYRSLQSNYVKDIKHVEAACQPQ